MGKKIRVAVIGAGYLGRLHAEKYARIDGAELVGVADTDVERAREVAASNGTAACASHKDLFGRVDAVSIVTPTESHARIGLDFLSKGVDVLMEKPIAVTVKGAARLVAEARRTKAVLQVGHLERFNAAVARLRGMVKKPVYIETQRLAPFPNRGTDVSVALDLMIHDIDIVLSMVKSPVKSIEAVAMPVVSGMADFANARVAFKNGCVANLTASRAARDRVRTLHLFQEGENIKIDYIAQSLVVSRKAGFDAGGKVAFEEVALEKSDSLLEELKAFVESSSRRTKPAVSGTDGMKALELAHMIQAAAKRRRR